MFSIPVIGPSAVFCDNKAVYKNVCFSESILHKKYNSIYFHIVRECVASTTELFQIQMRISFPFLRAKDLSTSLLIIQTSSLFTILYVGGTYERLVYTWYKNVFRMIALLIVFLEANKKKRI